ncbi:MAG TPA: hypothetical protein VKA46_29180 [Gemmataceae bacterium]|nr:hypothetical protein [Gemmataceae bacterium]
MQIPVLIEPIAGNGYRASGGQLLAVVVEAPTREEALAKLKEQLQARLRDGAEIVPLETAPQPHPLAKFVGMFKDDPLIKHWKKSMAEYRRQSDRDRDRP